MGSIVSLSVQEQEPFRQGLNAVRRALEYPEPLFERRLRLEGLRTIFVLANGIWQSSRWEHIFGEQLRDWVKKQRFMNRSSVAGRMFVFGGDRTGRGLQELELLKEVLADQEKRHALAEIGPCALHFSIPGDPRDDGRILISNFIPELWPNADWSIYSDGSVRFHS